MGWESTLRSWAHRHGLQRSWLVVQGYRSWSRVRYRTRWEDPVPFRGATFCIGRDLSLYPAVANGGFESAEIDSLLPRVRTGDVVWDVGANVGIYSVLLGRAAATGHVVAFEPVPQSRQRLVGNLARNHVTNVRVEERALSDREGVARMAVHADAHGCDRITTGSPDIDSPEGMLSVVTTTGTRFTGESELGAPDVIKVDIEGHEPEFLEGAWDVIAHRRPILMLEVNPTTWETEERFTTWSAMLRRLFELYGDGDWYGLDGSSRVSSVDVHALEPHAFTLILPAA